MKNFDIARHFGNQRGRRAAAFATASVLAAGALLAVPAAAQAETIDWAPADPSDSAVSLLATPTTTDLVVSARIAYQRAPIVDVDNPAYLEGVTFELFEPAGNAPGAATGYTCEIPAGALDCTISIPDTAPGGANAGDRFYVVMTSAGDNATPITELRTGTSSEPFTRRSYPGLTAPAVGGQTLAFPSQGTGEQLNSLVTAATLDNPTLDPSCVTSERLSLATQLDLSGSIDEQQRTQYREALEALVVSLEGEAVDLTVSTFGSSSPVAGRAGGPFALDTDAGLDAALDAIDSYVRPVSGATQQTNWDLALRKVADYSTTFDALLVVTDGAPNYVSNSAGTGGQEVFGSRVTIASLEQAVFSANAVKAEGTRILAMGVGTGVDGRLADNLAAISGPIEGSDYFQGAWSTLAADLQAAVSPLVCVSPVTATTFVTDAAGENPVATDGFTVGAATSAVSAGTATVTGDNPQVTGADGNPTGTADWAVSFSDADATATLTVTQDARAGLTLTGSTFTVTHADSTTTTGTGGSPLVIPGLTRSDRVEVSFTNAPTVDAATFRVRSVVEGSAADAVPDSTTFSVTYTVNGEAAATPLTVRADGTIVDAPVFEVGDVVVLTQGAQPAISGVEWGPVPPAQTITLTDAAQLVTFVNTATAVGPTPTPTPTSTTLPTPSPSPTSGMLPATGSEATAWPFLGGAAALLLGAAVFMVSRRRAARHS